MNKHNLIERIFLQLPIVLLLVFISVLYLALYYETVLLNSSNNVDVVGGFVNLHDHDIYIKELATLVGKDVSYELNNDVGIALIYYAVYVASGINSIFDIYIFSLFFNLLFLLLSFFYYNKICSRHKLSDVACLFFFLNFSFLYFSQLVNKDMLTVFTLIYTLYFGIKGRIIFVVLILPFAFLIRQQLALCLLTFLFLINVRNTFFWLVFSYILSSLAAGYISANLQLISAESMGSGFSSFLMSLNSQYYIGNLILNPVRVIQYFLSVPQSLIHAFGNGRLDLAALLRALTLPMALLALVFFVKSIFNLKKTLNSESKIYFLLTYSFFLCWLLNPTINARYLMLILPVMVLGYCYQSEIVKRNGN
ncbi:hypothetical protein [Shewanella algae]|uniref:hypothetical protein n=1 Tax=Shewanella algae TaxID=38313 RepID=UPI0031F582B2